ncbi:Cellulose synthase (UDP-forming) [Handroanthus impetiginosus]|uniref:Cellulose synthase (UDP-forming) n=1 Tax=Handroanthus impetiginosus TaxID=429701 RepID=A0A2G9H208_9LAMI|nr:Cellulose synthase (UDP-forming) [Handroanthus impetiginosus]
MAAVSLHTSYSRLSSRSSTMGRANPSLNTCTVQQPRATLSRLHMLFHFAIVLALLYYRISNLIHGTVPLLSWGLITLSELIFTFIWTLSQGFRWRPVVRTVAPENLPGDETMPGVDVFICTADPKKEPVVEVMNTVLSAMALDYPPEKLAVYLSDDGGAAVTLYAMKKASLFARSWLPFCRKYGIKTRCPEAFFSSFGDSERELLESDEFKAEEEAIQAKYDVFKRNVEKAAEIEDSVNDDRPPHVEVIHDNMKNDGTMDDKYSKMPLLVYVSREKRPSRPHRFKAGALNTLLRVSGIMSNAPYALVLDCDMYCNDPTSAKQAMCFHLDPKISGSLAYAQFPQVFYNICRNDIYDGQARSAYKTKYQGMDGLKGTVCSGTGYYLKKKALYCSPNQQDEFPPEPEKNFGFSTKLIDSLRALQGNDVNEKETISNATLEEAQTLASCTYEQNTSWGKEIGYSYDCLLESTFTGYLLHCKGWNSVYLYPDRPCFLGCTTIDMKDASIQLMKWASGLVQVGLSKFSPLTYGISRMPPLQCMCYGYFTFTHFFSVACFLYGVVPQLCFLYGIPLYPKVTDPWFAAFATVFFSSISQHLYEVISSGGSTRTMWNEQRIWMIKSVTACLLGCLDVVVKYIGFAKANFRLTNKAIDREKLEKYEKGKFDFQGAKMFMIPLTMLVLLNLGCSIGGAKRLIGGGNVEEMFGQGLLLLYILVLSLPILEGLIPKIGK